MSIKIKIANDFSQTPGARYRKDGKFSGEEFFEMLLMPKYKEAMESGSELVVDLDGTEGYATSFLDEAFRRLGEQFGVDKVLQKLKIISNEEPDWEIEIHNYITGE